MTGPRLSRALLVSAAVHVAAAVGLLGLQQRGPATPPMRVTLLALRPPGDGLGPTGGERRVDAAGSPPGPPRAAAAPERGSASAEERGTHGPRRERATTPTATSSRETSEPDEGSTSEARAPRRLRSGTRGAAGQQSAAVAAVAATSPATASSAASEAPGGESAAHLTPVQEDLWVLGASGSSGAGARAAAAAGGTGPGTSPSAGPAPGTGRGTGGSRGASLLEALQQRLAWSAARCAPSSAVHRVRHGVPGVPLHFCLDARGQPSGVGLLGTTGSEELDQAARDCVVPGAVPLPPAQGCYTVEVRFPARG